MYGRRKAALVNGAHVSSLTVGGNAEVRIMGGAKVDFLRAIGRSTVTADARATVSQVQSADDATVVLGGTLNTGLVDASDNVAISVTKGTKVAHLSASGHAKVKLGEGAEASQLTVSGDAAAALDDCPGMVSVDVSDNATLTANRGTKVAHLSASGRAEVTLNAGAEAGHVTGSGDSRFHILGGALGDLRLSGRSEVEIRKAVFLGVNLSTPTVSVSGGVITFTPGSAIHLHAGEVALANGKVTGAWENGDRFSFWLIEGDPRESDPSRALRRPKSPPKELIVHPFPGAKGGIGVVKAPLDVEGDASVEPSPFKRYPFMPTLLENEDEELCRLALGDARERFLSSEVDPPLVESGEDHFRWLEWTAVTLLDGLESFANWNLLELDLDGTGRKQALLQQTTPTKYDYEYRAFVFPSREAAVEALRRGPDVDDGPYDIEFEGGTMYHPGATVLVSDDPEEIRGDAGVFGSVFEFKGRYYFFETLLEDSRVPGETLGLFRLRSDGLVDRRCVIRTQPEKPAREALWAAPGVSSYLKVLRAIGGGYDYGAMAAVERAAYRPWAVFPRLDSLGGSNIPGDSAMHYFLNDWSFSDIWSRREYETYLEHVPAARRGLERYYRKAFGLGEKDAKEWADRAFEETRAVWISVPHDYGPGGNGVFYDRNEDPNATAIMAGILTGSPDHALECVRDLPRPLLRADYLHAAAESPKATRRLLDAGVPVDAGNAFGKTALMTAAHMNRPDVVRILLKREAGPGRKTQATSVHNDIYLHRSDRTALMYAAENAGPEVMKLLLDAGADPEARDSMGNGVSFYLQRNSWLTPEQRRSDVRSVAASASGKPKGPSFDCRKSTTAVERLICSDEVLGMQDRALAAAFARWLKLGGGREARSEQRGWLKSRDKECLEVARPDQVSCLQQKTRARIRYLHNRIAEVEKPGIPGDE